MLKAIRSYFYRQPNRKCEYATPEEEKRARMAAAQEQFKLWMAILPDILEKFSRIPDPRRPRNKRHKHTVLLFYGLLLFLFRYVSRREANRELTGPTVFSIVHSLFPEIDSIPHMDTLARFLEKVSVEEIERIIGETVKKLIHNKHLDRLVADGSYVIAVDGTQKWIIDWEFSPEALRKTYGNVTKYQVYVLEAGLVGPKGVIIPLMSEFCANPVDADEQTKQDCETNAFYRLAARLKSLFSKTPLMIVADGLYPTGPVMGLCRANHWDFMIVLPSEVRLSDVQEEAKAICDMERDQRLTYIWGDRIQEYSWANGILYTWRDSNGHYHHIKLNVVYCQETVEDGDEISQHILAMKVPLERIEKKTRRLRRRRSKRSRTQTTHKVTKWVWISSKTINSNNVVERCNGGARLRWNIEEGILTEKDKIRGYAYEHMFSYNWHGMKAWHALMHLGHLLNILTYFSTGIWKIAQQRGINGLLRWLRQSITGNWTETSMLSKLPEKPQLRLVI